MAISFEIPEHVLQQRTMSQMVAEGVMRPESRRLDENEHERPTNFISTMWPVLRDMQAKATARLMNEDEKPRREGPGTTILRFIVLAEQLSWGDVGQYLCIPHALLAGSAIEAVGTPEQKERFLRALPKAIPSGARWR